MTDRYDDVTSFIHTAWEQVKSKGRRDLLWADWNDDGVTRIVTACAACADVDLCREDVNEFTLAFVAPLCAENNGHCTGHELCIEMSMNGRPRRVDGMKTYPA